MRILIFLLLSTFFSFSQTKTITGIVSDTLNKPLENANIIANPFTKEAQLKFAIADNKGRYRLELEKEVKYEVTVSYIGYKEEVIIIEPNSTITLHNFILKSTGQQLKEIVIKHEYKPVVIKKDTMTFNVKSFANGNERKMKEILEKLPGVEVDKKGTVTVQGKKVTKMLVEGKSFFGGGSKLAVENIPADALDKIEVIDHFNEVGFMKKVSDSEDLAMNVKLKENKKKFIFGDIEAGAEIANDNGFYLAHAGLFYYSPKTNFSFIGDSNNIGKSTFTFEDLMRFDGGFSSFLSGRKSFTNLYNFASDNTDVLSNKSNFSALNYSIEASNKTTISGYGIFSKGFTSSFSNNSNQYIQNNFITFEKSTNLRETKSTLGIVNTKLDYSPSNTEKWFYNIQLQASNNKGKSNINTVSNNNSSFFESLNNADNQSLKQYIEWHKSINENHTTTFVMNNAIEKNTPFTHWFTNQPFLTGLIPLQNDVEYTLEQTKKVNNTSIDALFKHYWIINNFNHLYSVIGNNYDQSKLNTNEKQLLTNGSVNDFSTNGFGNSIKYTLNDIYLGLEYKFKIGKWTNKPGVYFHQYDLNTKQETSNHISKFLIQPQFNSDYEFSQAESINFSYKLSNSFAEVSQYANQFTLQNYNLVFKGNALLNNEQFHNANLRYSKSNMYRGIMINAIVNFNKKTKTIRNEIELSGINQFTTPILTNNPETSWRAYGMLSKKIYRFTIKFSTSLNWFEYIQKINNLTNTVQRNSQNLGISARTTYKKWPDIEIGYKKGFNQFKSQTNSSFETNEFNADIEIPFRKSFVFKFEYENFKNSSTKQNNYFEIANTSLSYQKKNSPLRIEVFANNLFNNKIKTNNSFSDYLITEQQTYILPRVFMLSLSYKL
ncbi:carboxypeptidase regulatory-like domain-containing protein [Flavobacterium terrae]|uniref:Outer membrane receptor proteins, mostly Fe transport n=1 Tax=Flavobacterium terrae TaxID=415425 RepID=A0A1M6DS18_9FLAO|nr:carboxypeptidase-like regulatory domain-containing protein [Flavobacterium terrae]SHI75920.1 Outer membrane receptor proteins, mostly Fe transport [Flavobacterium terrae]